jgi:Uncharacterised protein family (UPF0104).
MALGVWAMTARARLAAVLRQGLLTPGIRGRQAALSLGTVALNLLAFALCARATGTALGFAATLTLVPVILFSMVLPLSLGGWGLREGSAAALFPLAGASSEAGLAASVAFGLAFLVSSLPGAAILLLDWRGSAAPPVTDSGLPPVETRPALSHSLPDPNPFDTRRRQD